jgi:uncharacterized protein (TIGR03437 family)
MKTRTPVTVTIGGQSATVLWAGLVEAGLWQINVEVPATLSAQNNAVIATVNGHSSQTGAMLSIAASYPGVMRKPGR